MSEEWGTLAEEMGTPAGADWYPDPAGKYEHRFWDGAAWTDQVHEQGAVATDPFFRADESLPPPGTAPTAVTEVVAPPGPARRRSRAPLVAVAVIAVLALAAVAFVLTRGSDDKKTISATASSSSSSDTTTSSTTTSTTKPTTTTVTAADVVGLSVADATAKLRASGKTVTVTEAIDTTKPDGTVTQATPTSGSANDVTIIVARPPVERFLASQATVSSDHPSTGVIDVSGTTYVHSIFGEVENASCSSAPSRTWEYDLGRDYRRLQSTLGVSDDSPALARVRFEVFADSSPVYTMDIGLGETQPLDLDVTGVLRLKLVMTETVKFSGSCSGPVAVWADAKLLGVPSEVPPETSSN
jgi:serine/threonine-protein kinase